MLIRLVGHYIDNPNRIDKLICIKGLPEDWILRTSRFGGKELVKPWEPDVEANIPRECRHLCEPMEITQVFAPVEKGREYTVDKKTILAVRFDYVSEPGQTMWDQIERFMDRTVPRDVMVPKPVLVAPDHKSPYSPHEARRTVRGSLELRAVENVPVIDLNSYIVRPEPVAAAPVVSPAKIEVAPKVESFNCTLCTKVFNKEQALKMHVMRGHRKEPVGV